MINNQVLPTLNLVYRSTCDYTGNWWNQYEMVQGWVFYDDNGEFYLRVKHGKKFPNVEGRIAIIGYHSWDDLLKDWWVPRIVKADSWAEQSASKNFEGNTDLDIIGNVYITFHEVVIAGWSNNERKTQLIWMG